VRWIAAALALVLSSCSEGAGPASGSHVGTTGLDPATTKEVLKLVREFSGDSRASISGLKQNDIIVCGTAWIDGASRPFYVDLSDEEAFLASGEENIDTLINAACF
jgi:hypothetical protein